ncbi:G-protein coupled receptor Mth2-like [Sitodiplosis mosellana]|uniref:G-protein coupled receptor Mth2-like n=1 Tax=Sitodiplosis mosellana TaxID=263140 RepID=UPI0024442147|nr:G-protein coupled receptor Mth2-like [Sitodiplosis mosellana]
MKWRIFCLLVIVINTTVSKRYDKLPCEFLESVNITGGKFQADDSIIFENIAYTKYAYLTHVLENGTTSRKTNSYLRGCIPENRPFIRLLCPFGTTGEDCPSYQNVRNLKHAVKFDGQNKQNLTLDHYFGFLFDQPCPDLFDERDYQILHTGDACDEDASDEDACKNIDDVLGHTQYSLEFSRNSTTNEIESKLWVCFQNSFTEQRAEAKTFPDSTLFPTTANMFISAILLTATFTVYLYLPDLDHFFGKMLMCFLSGPAMSYFLIVLVKVSKIPPESSIYDTIGYTVFFSFMSSFAWLNVISFNLWKSFRTINGLTAFSQQKLLLLYMFYAWGSALFLTLLFHAIEPSKATEQLWVSLSTCFLDDMKRNLCAGCLKYYIPIWILFAVSQLFFTLTGIIVYSCCNDNEVRFKFDRQRSHINDGDNFSLHLRLHMATCLTWILKALTMQYGMNGIGFYANISYTLQGLVIFVIFVMNRHVLHLIHKRWKNRIQRETKKRQRTMSIRSQTSYEVLKPEAENHRDVDSKNSIEQGETIKRPRTVSFRSHISHEKLKTEAKSPWEQKPLVFDANKAVDEIDAIKRPRTVSFRTQASTIKPNIEEKNPWEKGPWVFDCNKTVDQGKTVKRQRTVSFQSQASPIKPNIEEKNPWEKEPWVFDSAESTRL